MSRSRRRNIYAVSQRNAGWRLTRGVTRLDGARGKKQV